MKPDAQDMQLAFVEPLQVKQEGSQGVHTPIVVFMKLLVGHATKEANMH